MENAKSALKSIKNLREDLPLEEIEVVLHQEAIDIALSNGEYSNLVLDLMTRDIGFAVCYNSMKARDLKSTDLIDGIKIVDAGVGEIIKLQKDGWAYLKL
ncbi:DsrE family protein [Oxyplasma meridianum]|uniref:DsrE family protein n=1 Tax=Oxyplasma meridianum TaxID=3073602 RepID=A0AAX4NGL1_9ARCH